MPLTRRDIEYRVVNSLIGFEGDYDIEYIVDDLIHDHHALTGAPTDPTAYWTIIATHAFPPLRP